MFVDKFYIEPNKVVSTVIVAHICSLTLFRLAFCWHLFRSGLCYPIRRVSLSA